MKSSSPLGARCFGVALLGLLLSNPLAATIYSPGNNSNIGRPQGVPSQIVPFGNNFLTGGVTFSATGLPAGYTLDPATGIIRGTTLAATGNVNVTLVATYANATQLVFEHSAAVTANSAFSWPASTLPTGYATAAGAPAPVWTAEGLPAGATIDAATGVVTGTPTETGTFVYLVKANWSTGMTFTRNFVIGVSAVPTLRHSITVGESYAFDLKTVYPNATAFAVTVGTLPAGITLDGATGLLAGTPTVATSDGGGGETVTVSVTQPEGDTTATVTFDIISRTIRATNFSTPANIQNYAFVFAPGEMAAQSIDATPGATFSWAPRAGSMLPPGLTLSGGGVISGTPTTPGDYLVQLRATYADGGVVTNDATIYVRHFSRNLFDPQNPTARRTIRAARGQSLTPFDLGFTGRPTGYSIEITSAAPNNVLGTAAIDANGILSGTLAALADNANVDFTVTATYADGSTATQLMRLNHRNPKMLNNNNANSSLWRYLPGEAVDIVIHTDGDISAITGVSLPAGLSVELLPGNRSFRVGGVVGNMVAPGEVPTFNFNITFANGITMNKSNDFRLRFRTDRSLNPYVGKPFSFALPVVAGATYTWYPRPVNGTNSNVSTVSLPPGLSMDANGVITGTPTDYGEYAVRAVATVGTSRTVFDLLFRINQLIDTATYTVGSSFNSGSSNHADKAETANMGNTVSYDFLKQAVAEAVAGGFGGVLDFENPTFSSAIDVRSQSYGVANLEAKYGLSGEKTLTISRGPDFAVMQGRWHVNPAPVANPAYYFQPSNDNNAYLPVEGAYGVHSVGRPVYNDRNILDGLGLFVPALATTEAGSRFAPTSGKWILAGPSVFDLILSGPDRVKMVGFTLLAWYNFQLRNQNAQRVWVTYDDGSKEVVFGSAYTDEATQNRRRADTFYGLRAPAGKAITGVTIYVLPGNGRTFPNLEDFIFVTEPSAGIPAPALVADPAAAVGILGFGQNVNVPLVQPSLFNRVTAIGVPPGLTFDYATGVLSGRPAFTGTANVAVTVTSDTGTVTQVVPITVAPAPLTIVWTAPSAIGAGTALSASQLNAVATGAGGAVIPGTFRYDPPVGTVLPVGTYTLTATFVPSGAAASEYAPTTATNTLSVLAGYAGWAAANLGGFPEPDRASSADANGDGVSNLFVYALGLDPAESYATSDLWTTSTSADGTLQLVFERPILGISGVSYRVQYATDMGGPWTDIPAANYSAVQMGSTETVTARDVMPMAEGMQRFLRLVVEVL